MPLKRKLSKNLCGVAGEYLVAAELSRRGYVASLTLRNARGIDILASNADATRSVGIQVKTAQGKRSSWVLTAKAEQDLAENLYYVFVSLGEDGEDAFHIVPRAVVAKHVREGHKRWLATPGRDGRARGDSEIRKFRDADGSHLNRWDLLGLD